MNRFVRSLVAALTTVALLVSVAPSTAGAEVRDNLWSDEFWVRGFDADISHAIEDGEGNFYAVGQFTAIDGEPFRHIAMWNGSSWSHLANGLSAPPEALAIDGEGRLIVVGDLELVEGGVSSGVMRWDGERWSSLSPSSNGAGNDIVVKPNGDIVVAFGRWAQSVRSWNGSQWSEILSMSDLQFEGVKMAVDAAGTLYTANINGLSVGDRASGVHRLDIEQLLFDGAGILYAHGREVPNEEGTNLDYETWVWDGTSWTLAFTDWVGRSLSLDQSGQLISGSSNQVARWDGTSWISLGIDIYGVARVATFGDGLVILGYFDRAGDLEVNGLALWLDGTWQAMHGSATGAGTRGRVDHAVVDNDGNLFASGNELRSVGDVEGSGYWDGESWTAVPDLDHEPNFVVTNNGLLSVRSGAIRRWDGSDWEVLEDRLDIEEIAADGRGGIIAAGWFDALPDGTPASRIARWDGKTWEPLGDGIDFRADEIAVDNRGNVFVAQHWLPLFRQWDGTVWITHETSRNRSLAGLRLDTDGELITGGYGGLAKWSGKKWIPFGPTSRDSQSVSARTNPCGELVVLTSNALIKRTHAGVWETFASVTGGTDVLFSGRDVYVIGRQLIAGGVSQSGVARWTDPGPPSISEALSVSEIPGSCDYQSGSHGDVLRLYQAFFDREPDVGGAQYWIDVNGQDQTLDQIADYFTLGQEFANNYEGTTDRQYLEAVYRNVLGREYDQAGFDYWLSLLESGELTRGGVVRWIAANQEFINRFPYRP